MILSRTPVLLSAGLLAASMVLSACAPASTSPTESAPPATSSEAPAASASPLPDAAPTAMGAVDGFLAWLDASRKPDPETACRQLSPELVIRMLAELNAQSPVQAGTCEEMINTTAELYRATGQDPAVDIAVQEETATAATLFVTYLSSGDCGTVVMERPGTDWIITELSQECAG
ncbi:hypothetical protein [Plantibacter flavus]|uniref:hypothetical protein n=1 Tax=Plantibacter flavus TaxID=150123 RepID=UPI001F011137|nr:hypothetical protein [Plantibacter flavus]